LSSGKSGLPAMSYNGNIKVPGCSWKRDREGFKKQKDRITGSRNEENERNKALKQSQEEVLRYLASKSKASKSAGHDHSSAAARRFREEPGNARGEEDEEYEDDRKRVRREDDRKDGRDETREPRRRRDRSDSRDGDRASGSTQRRRDDRDMPEQRGARRHDDDADSARPSPITFTAAPLGAWEDVVEEEEDSRRTKLAIAFSQAQEEEKEGLEEKKRAAETKQKKQAEEQARKKKLAGAFGLDEDDEDDDARRSLQIAAAAAAKKAQVKRDQLSHTLSSASRPDSGGPSGGHMDTYAALKAMADWKRGCNGATRAIPQELKNAVLGVSRHG